MVHNTSVEAILAEATEIAEPEKRQAYVEQACAGDSVLQKRVERLIESHFRAGEFLERPVATVESVGPPGEETRIGSWIGPYKLLEQIGEGGFGSVYLAEQLEPVRRQVALKVIKPGMDSKQVIARFEVERQAMAMMDHPNIAKVFDAGTTDLGRPYFVMELIRGIPITDYCDEARLTIPQRLALFAQVCRAVQHAHTKGIIHRDLKPSNVLVTSHDGTPLCKVIDFGVAKALGEPLTDRTLHTGFSQLIGTPAYMSPEQAEFNQLGIDTHSDIYSLGVLLYELLTGAPPFDQHRLRSVEFDELRRIIREEEPARPSVRVGTLPTPKLSTITDRRGVNSHRLIQQIHGELDWIVMKALEKDRSRRFETASDFAADVERFLQHQPVQARPASRLYRFRKFARRNRAAIVAVTSVAMAVAVGALVGIWQLIETNRAHSLANRSLLSELEARTEAQHREAALRLQRYTTDLGLAFQAFEGGQLQLARGLLDRYEQEIGDDDPRGFEWHYLATCCRPVRRTLQSSHAELLTAASSPDERLLASGDREGYVSVWDMATGTELQTLRYSTHEVTCVRFSPDGATLATAGQDQTIRLWDTTSWAERACLRGHSRTVTTLAWSPDKRWLASGDRNNQITIWDAVTQERVHGWEAHADVVQAIAWSPDSKLLASAGKDQVVQLWEPATWRLVGTLKGATNDLLCLAFSPDSKQIASSGYGAEILLHDVQTRAESARVEVRGSVRALVFSPNGNQLVSAGGWLHVWEVSADAREIRPLRSEHLGSDTMRAAMIYQNGETLVTANHDERTIKFRHWPSLIGRQQMLLSANEYAVCAKQGLVLTADYRGSFRLVSLDTGELIQPQQASAAHLPTTQRMSVSDAAFSPDGKRFATCRSNRVLIWDTKTTEKLHPIGDLGKVPTPVFDLAFSPDGTLLAGGDEEGVVWLWDIATNSVKAKFGEDLGSTRGRLAFSPDGKVIATSSHLDSTIHLWDTTSGKRLGELRGTQGNRALAFNPDGTILAAGGQLHGVTLWEVNSRQELGRLIGHQGEVEHVSFSPDAQTLATTGKDQTVRLWHIPTQRELFTLLRPHHKPTWVQFASDRKLLVGLQTADKGTREILAFEANLP